MMTPFTSATWEASSTSVMPGMQPEAAELFMNLVLGEDETDDETPEEDADGAS